jgi:hypothetical protein
MLDAIVFFFELIMDVKLVKDIIEERRERRRKR